MNNNRDGMIFSLQVCRAVAAWFVLVFHVFQTAARDKYFGATASSFHGWTQFGGDAGVSFFFVLSGFIIFYVHRRNLDQPRYLGEYLRRRVVRVYPTYLIVFSSVVLVGSLSQHSRGVIPTDAWELFKLALLLPQSKEEVLQPGGAVLGVAWSLQFEVFFYVLFAVFIVSRRAGAVIALFYAPWFLAMQIAPPSREWWDFYASSYMILFVLGVVVAWLFMNYPLKGVTLSPLLLFVTLFLTVCFSQNAGYFERSSLLLTLAYGVTAAGLVYTVCCAELRGIIRVRNKIVILLGDSSYSLYLLHIPMLSAAFKLVASFGFLEARFLIPTCAMIILICIVVSAIFHLVVEKPILDVLSGRRTAHP